MPAARFPSFRQLQIGDYWAECPQLTTASQGEFYSVRYRQQIPEVVSTYTDRREADIPQYITLFWTKETTSSLDYTAMNHDLSVHEEYCQTQPIVPYA